MNFKARGYATARFGIFIQGLLWLFFWLGPAFHFFEADFRWAHNFALSLIFITVGSASYFKKISCEFVAVLSSFLTIPTFLGFILGINATYFALLLLILNIDY